MMKVFLVLLGLVWVSASQEDARMDFIRAMDEVQNLENLQRLQNRLLLHAEPRRSLDENATEYYGTLDLTQFAMKYVGCQNVKSFSDDLAEDNDSKTVLGYNRFVVFRLCPANKCSAYNKYGCQDSFGEYIIEMEMYLEIMSQYHHQKYLEYCATCIACMNPPNDDTLYTEYNSTTNETIYTWSAAGDCQYYDACQNYNQACKNYDASTDDNAYSEILGCSESALDDYVVYRGPHCASNGKSITMGLFKDNECTKYIQNEADSGSSSSDDSLLQFFYNPTCVSCVNTNTYGLYSDDSAGAGVYEMCEVLYEASGKCNRYMNPQSSGSTYSSSVQEDDETRVCTFVESLMTKTYDETGEIIIKSESFSFSDWRGIPAAVSEVSPVQQIGLIASLSLMLGLLVYSIYLYIKVKRMHASRNIYPTYKADEVVRNESGIGMTRTVSEFGIYA